MLDPQSRQKTENLLDFIEASPTPFHCVQTLLEKCKSTGFTLLNEGDAWELEAGEKYMVVRQDSSFCAFIMGTNPPHEAGFRMIGAHTDSPNLRLKPNPLYHRKGYVQLGVEVYGGALINTWLDRDLSIAGRIIIDKGGVHQSRLIRINRPVARIPQLAIHLDRKVNEEGLKLNKQKHMPPIISLDTELTTLEEVLSKTDVNEGPVISFDLQLYDTQKPTLSGVHDEFIHSPRLDNQAMCFSAIESLIEKNNATKHTRLVVCFDHEEVGSLSSHGGDSSYLRDILERLVSNEAKPQESYFRAIAKSFLISADMAHAIHPNYKDIHEEHHRPLLNGGPVVKTNANNRYSSNGVTSGIFTELCRQVDVPVQHVVVRTDMGCGSTIGPMTTAKLGVKGVDIGNPMISMHSIREMAGSKDPFYIDKVFTKFFEVAQLPHES